MKTIDFGNVCLTAMVLLFVVWAGYLIYENYLAPMKDCIYYIQILANENGTITLTLTANYVVKQFHSCPDYIDQKLENEYWTTMHPYRLRLVVWKKTGSE